MNPDLYDAIRLSMLYTSIQDDLQIVYTEQGVYWDLGDEEATGLLVDRATDLSQEADKVLKNFTRLAAKA